MTLLPRQLPQLPLILPGPLLGTVAYKEQYMRCFLSLEHTVRGHLFHIILHLFIQNTLEWPSCHPQVPSQLYFSPSHLLLLNILYTLLICFIVCSSLLECEPHEGMNEGMRLIVGITKKDHKFGGLHRKTVLSPRTRGQNFEIKVFAGWVSSVSCDRESVQASLLASVASGVAWLVDGILPVLTLPFLCMCLYPNFPFL